ncbi:MAG: hypothetical protein L3J83_01700 [Proteobacteria bacterium]|nr:hypothetical protein [Pseudomonadota bacterium]
MKNKINKWGNSHGIRLTARMLKHLHAVDGDQLEIELTKDGIKIIKNNIQEITGFHKEKEKIISDMMQQTDPVQLVTCPDVEGVVHYIVIAVDPIKPIIRQVPKGYIHAYKTLTDAKQAARTLIQQSIGDAKKSLAGIRQIGIEKIKYLSL